MSDRQGNIPERGNTRAVVLMVLLVLAAAAAALRANIWKADLHVASVRIQGNRIVPTEDLLTLAHISAGDRLFDVDLYSASKRLLENRFVRSASVNRDVPNRITISVTERVPVAAVVAQKKFYLDADGFVLPPALSENIFDLPIITGSLPTGELIPGKRISSPQVKEALAILTTAQVLADDLYRVLSELRILDGKDIIGYTAEYGIPVIFGHGDIAPKLVKLDGFWREVVLRHGAQELQYIDLRFDDCVVVRWNHQQEELQASSM